MTELPPPGALGRFDWERMVRHSGLHRSVKGTALALATFADADGSRVMPGADALARACSAGSATVRRHLKVLREGGFVVLVRKGNVNSSQKADVYQLSFCPVRSGGISVVGVANLWAGREITNDLPSPGDEGSAVISRQGDERSAVIARVEGREIISEGTGDHFEGVREITGDPQPEHNQPQPDHVVTTGKVTTDRDHSPEHPEAPIPPVVKMAEYRPANPIYAAARETLRSKRTVTG